MTLNELMPDFLSGARIRRTSWREGLYLKINKDANQAKLFESTQGLKLLSIDESFSLDDLTSKDWEVINT